MMKRASIIQRLSLSVFLLSTLCAALAPALRPPLAASTKKAAPPQTAGSEDWPAEFRAMKEIDLTPVEKRFALGFPGRIAKFSDGKSEFILRKLRAPTRKLHPATDCFRASGYQLESLSKCPKEASSGDQSCTLATLDGQRLLIQESISDSNSQQFRDVSSWYFATIWQKTEGPWLSITRVSHYRDAT